MTMTTQYRNLRPYDGEKHRLLVDMLAHEASMNGWEEDILEHDGRVVAVRITAPWNMADLYEFTGEGDVTLNCDEQRLILGSEEFFVLEDEQGFVTVEWYATYKEAEQNWQSLSELYPHNRYGEDERYEDRNPRW